MPPIYSLLLIATALLGALAAALWIRISRVTQLQRRSITQLTTLQQDLRALCNAAVAVGERVNRLEQQLRLVDARQEQIGVRQDRLDQVGGGAYDQAIKMARKGASLEDLVEVCGLTQGEAELIAMMHRYGGTPG